MRGDVEANLEQHLRLAALAAEAGAQLCIFPELSLTGYEIDLAEKLAFAPADPRLAPLADAAAAHAMTLVVGAPVALDARLHIGAFVLAPDRSLEIYTKRHLGAFSGSARVDGRVPPAEATVFAPGDRDPLVRLGDGTAAVAICADTGRPSHPERAARRGARSYLASVFVIPSAIEEDVVRLAGYAAKHAMAVVFANYGGPSGGLAAAGRSAVWSETGELLARLEPRGAGVVVASESDAGWRAQAIGLDAAGDRATRRSAPRRPRPAAAPRADPWAC